MPKVLTYVLFGALLGLPIGLATDNLLVWLVVGAVLGATTFYGEKGAWGRRASERVRK